MEKETLYQKIYNDLQEGIDSKRYIPGSKLPTENELAEQYNVSRITSKKALDMLAEQNIITRKPGRGSYVIGKAAGENEKQLGEVVFKDKKTIGVIFDAFDAAFGCDILIGIERECTRNNLNMVLKCTYGSVEAEMSAIDDVLEAGAAGIIIMCAQDEVFNANILKCSVEDFPVVLLDRPMPGVPIPCVTTDNYAATRDLIDWLFDHGHTKIGYVSHNYMQTPTIKERLRGFIDSNIKHNVITNETMWIQDIRSCINYSEENRKMDEERVEKYILEHPEVTAIFTVQYSIGLLVYSVLKKMELHKKIQIVFFDGLDEAVEANPIFTRVRQGEYLMGVVSVQLLIERINGKSIVEKRFIPYEIVEGSEINL